MNTQIPTDGKDALAAVRYKYVLDTDRVILARGHLDRDGGFVTLIRAMPRILERFPDAQLVVVGCGPALHEILSETHKLGVCGHDCASRCPATRSPKGPKNCGELHGLRG